MEALKRSRNISFSQPTSVDKSQSQPVVSNAGAVQRSYSVKSRTVQELTAPEQLETFTVQTHGLWCPLCRSRSAPVSEEDLHVVCCIAQQASRGTATIREYVAEVGRPLKCAHSCPAADAVDDRPDVLMVAYTSLELEQIMCIAELWQLKRETCNMSTAPLVIHHAELDSARGWLKELKRLVAMLMLGLDKVPVLSLGGQAGVPDDDDDEHKSHGTLLDRREDMLAEICEQIEAFSSRGRRRKRIDFYILTPPQGNISDIARRLKTNEQVSWHFTNFSCSMKWQRSADAIAMANLEKSNENGKSAYSFKEKFFQGCNAGIQVKMSMQDIFTPWITERRYSLLNAAIHLLTAEQARAMQCPPISPTLSSSFRRSRSEKGDDPRFGFAQTMPHARSSIPQCDFIVEQDACYVVLSTQWMFLHELLQKESQTPLIPQDIWAQKTSLPEEAKKRLKEELLRYLRLHIDSLEEAECVRACGMELAQEQDEILDDALEQASSLVDCLQGGRKLKTLLEELDEARYREWNGTGDVLMVALTDLDPCDAIALAQLCQLKSEREELCGEPVIIQTIRSDKAFTQGKLREKRELIAGLLGFRKWYKLLDDSRHDDEEISEEESRAILKMQEERAKEVRRICERIRNFNGKTIELYIFAPPFGTLDLLVTELKKDGVGGCLPHEDKWRISIYTGSYNIRGFTKADMISLEALMSGTDSPLLDLGKYTFFNSLRNHPRVNTLLDFVPESFIPDLVKRHPLFVAALKLFSDEQAGALIAPEKLFSVVLDKSQQARYDRIREDYYGNDCQAYAQAIVEDRDLFVHLKQHKKSTVLALAQRKSDIALCEQLFVLCELDQTGKKRWLNPDLKEGYWQIHREGRTSVEARGSIKVQQPSIKWGRDQESQQRILDEMGEECAQHCLRYLDALNKEVVPPAAYNLRYTPTAEELRKATSIVQSMHAGLSIDAVCMNLWSDKKKPDVPDVGDPMEDDVLMLAYTDNEPDDNFGLAQLWQWKIHTEGMKSEPIVIIHTNFDSKDGGMIFEKKLLLSRLIVGAGNFYLFAHHNDAGGSSEHEGPHPAANAVRHGHEKALTEVCQRLANFKGKRIDFYMLAPGYGHIREIVDELKKIGVWPLTYRNGEKTERMRWCVKMYSGAFNMRGTQDQDEKALQEICGDEPLIDMSKFKFFGELNAHPWTTSLTTFALPEFAERVTEGWPMAAAVLKLFNDDFNLQLVGPKGNIFKGVGLSADEKARYKTISALLDSEDTNRAQKYGQALVADKALFLKVVQFKKSIVKSLAVGSCESPLCDQLVFLYEWLEKYKPESLKIDKGWWTRDPKKGFTGVVEDKEASTGIWAFSPQLAEPRNEPLLMEMRKALEVWVLKHLEFLNGRRDYVDRSRNPRAYPHAKLCYTVPESSIQEAQKHIDDFELSGHPLLSADRRKLPAAKTDGSELLMIYTDLTPDDFFAAAQLWEWKASRGKLAGDPLIIDHVNFALRDHGKLVAKKSLIAQLVVGPCEYHQLTHDEDHSPAKVENEAELEEMLEDRDLALDRICERIKSFEGEYIDFYVWAPGYGNLKALVTAFQQEPGVWDKAKSKFRLTVDGSAYNFRGMIDDDIKALQEITLAAKANGPPVEIHRANFLGGCDSHPITASMATFASDTFADNLSRRCPLLAAMLKLHNEEYNESRIVPGAEKELFHSPLDPEEKATFTDIYDKMKDENSEMNCTKYAKKFMEDEALLWKVKELPRSILQALASDACYMPLRSQLVFLYEWLKEKMPDAIASDDLRSSRWADSTILVSHPRLKNPKDEKVLKTMQQKLESYLMQHLERLQSADGQVEQAASGVKEMLVRLFGQKGKISWPTFQRLLCIVREATQAAQDASSGTPPCYLPSEAACKALFDSIAGGTEAEVDVNRFFAEIFNGHAL